MSEKQKEATARADSWAELLAVYNGEQVDVLGLRSGSTTGQLRSHDRKDYVTVVMDRENLYHIPHSAILYFMHRDVEGKPLMSVNFRSV